MAAVRFLNNHARHSRTSMLSNMSCPAQLQAQQKPLPPIQSTGTIYLSSTRQLEFQMGHPFLLIPAWMISLSGPRQSDFQRGLHFWPASLQVFLCPFQSAFWQSLLQYHTLQHALHADSLTAAPDFPQPPQLCRWAAVPQTCVKKQRC